MNFHEEMNEKCIFLIKLINKEWRNKKLFAISCMNGLSQIYFKKLNHNSKIFLQSSTTCLQYFKYQKNISN